MTNKTDEIRKSVSKDYALAVTRRTEQAGCGCCSAPVQKGVAAKLAGYTDEELFSLPKEAVVNSFGCGNPLAFSEVRQGETVLDLGSGAGIDLLLAARRVGPEGLAIGVDMTDEMIAKAQENIAAAGLKNVIVKKGIIEALPVESASVDWVISNCVINLSPEKPRVFKEIARVLKPGGTMLVSDIVAESLPTEVTTNKQLYSSCLAGAISEQAYLDGLAAAGLVDVEVLSRLVYDAAQLKALVGSELPDTGETVGCCGTSIAGDAATIDAIASTLDGKVWSAKVRARKP